MDDIIQVIIWLVIIFSFISGFFKKDQKPKEDPKTPQRKPYSYKETEDVLYPEHKVKLPSNDPGDILREIEAMFKTPGRDETAIPEKSYGKEIIIDKYGEHSRKPQEVTPSDLYTREDVYDKYNEHSRTEDKKIVVNKSIEELANRLVEVEKKHYSTNLYVLNLRKKLKDPASLREAIIINEIIGKPKFDTL